MDAQIQQILSRVPACRQARDIVVEPQAGGYTNANRLLVIDGERYVLRIGGENAGPLGIDRRRERDALLAASGIGVAPEVLAFLLPEGHLITRHIEGRAPTRQEFQQPDVIRRVARTMRRVHALPPIEGGFSPYRDVERRLEKARERGLSLPVPVEPLLERLYQIEECRKKVLNGRRVLCHNDPFDNNFLDDGQTMRLLDWEFAGMGDPFYDLASVAHFFPADKKAFLLECYLGQAAPADIEAMDQMWFVVSFWNVTWALLQQGGEDTGFDYAGMVRRVSARMQERL